jgi:ABC-type glycerol-3-phosphate transport system substrate-binding protein
MLSVLERGDGRGRWRRHVWIAFAAAVAMAVAGCGGGSSGSGSDPGGEVVISCGNCQASPTDPFLQLNYEAVKRFNKRYAGKYRVKVRTNQYASSSPARLQYLQRLALADDLPDVFMVDPSELGPLQKTNKLMDFAPVLKQERAWTSTFYQGAFDVLKGANGKVWGIPIQRDAIGIYYNKGIFHDAGIAQFPETWDRLTADCAKIKALGKTCMAMDGDWATLLMWANLIGTQPEGKDFLASGIAKGGYATDPAVVKATDLLKRWHAQGYVNKDAFSGDFNDAATPFLSGDAATIANGPWMVSTKIKTNKAKKGLYAQTGYAPSPGWTADGRGVIVVAGEGAWVSGSRDKRKQEAVTAWVKFMSSRTESIEHVLKTGAYPAVKLQMTGAEATKLEPLAAGLVKQSSELPTYPHAYFRAPSGFSKAWKNLWPAYVKGDMDTKQFLTRLAEDATSKTA